MSKVLKNKALSLVLCLAVLISCFGTVGAFITSAAPSFTDNLKSGKYELKAEYYPEEAFMKMPAIITIDTEAKTFNTQDAREGKDLANKGFGSYSFDEATGVYTVTYIADTREGTTTTFTYSDNAITFTSPMMFGMAMMNITDDDGNFIPYTAKLEEDKPDDEPAVNPQFDKPYKGTTNDDSTGVLRVYESEIIFSEDGTYEYKTHLSYPDYPDIGTYNWSKSGKWTASGNKLTLSESASDIRSTVDNDNQITLNHTPYSGRDSIKMILTIKSDVPSPIDSDFKEGTYEGSFEKQAMSGVGINYDISASFKDGKYSYDVRVQLTNGEYDNQDSTKTGTYKIEDNKLIFDGGNIENAEITGEGMLKLYGTLSSFAFAPDYADVIWVSDKGPDDEKPIHDDQNNIYAFTSISAYDFTYGEAQKLTIVCEGPFADFTDVLVDGIKLDSSYYSAEEGSTKIVISDEFMSSLEIGKHYITLAYTNGSSNQLVIRTAKAEGSYTDELKSGNYELKLDDFDDSVGVHRHPCIITIDTEGMTFIIHDTNDEITNKGSGTISFDSATGEYTMNYIAGGPETQTDPTSTFVFDSDCLVFRTPLKLGRSMMNIRDENGKFISYTAVLISEEYDEYANKLKSGSYELTEESYDASAFMKVPAIITIDTENKTFAITDNREATKGEPKGSGYYEFNAVTGVYTMTYTSGIAEGRIGSTATFVYSDDSITFTSPMLFGSAMMNITDEDGNFIPYTAKLMNGEEKPDPEPEQPVYIILNGADGTVAFGAPIEYRVRCSGPVDKFTGLYMDDVLISISDYTVSEGSTIVVLSPSYMQNLSEGIHTLSFAYTDGTAQTTITVKNASGSSEEPDNTNNSINDNQIGNNGQQPTTNNNSGSEQQQTNNNAESSGKTENNVPENNTSSNVVSTGDSFTFVIPAIMLISFSAVVICFRKRKTDSE